MLEGRHLDSFRIFILLRGSLREEEKSSTIKGYERYVRSPVNRSSRGDIHSNDDILAKGSPEPGMVLKA